MTAYIIPSQINEIQAAGEYVLVDSIVDEESIRKGIIIPYKEKCFRKGVILKVGTGKTVKEKTIPLNSNINDVVLYDHDKAQKVSINSKTLYLIKEAEGVYMKIGDLKEGVLEFYEEI